MKSDSEHRIGDQNTAYRRGVVLGLTMAEAGILIIFVLLLLIGLETFRRENQAKAMEGLEAVDVERLRTLEESELAVTDIRHQLNMPDNTTPDEISRLVRALQEGTRSSDRQSTLQEVKRALAQMRAIRDQIEAESGSEALAQKVEQQSYQLSNQEGQLKRYEKQLNEAGLGKGGRPCWVKADGTIEYLYDVVLESDGIRLREYTYPERRRERALLPMPQVDPTEVLSPGEFLRRTEPLYNQSLAANCRFYVVVYDATGPTEKEHYKRLLRTVEGHFYKRLDRGRAPF